MNRKKRPPKPALYSDADRERIVDEGTLPPHAGAYRSEFRRDYARLVHSPAVRRLQGKTQLFPPCPARRAARRVLSDGNRDFGSRFLPADWALIATVGRLAAEERAG